MCCLTSSKKGQALQEYILIGALIIVMIIPTMLIFSGNFAGLLGRLYNNMNKTVLAQATPLSQSALTQTGDVLAVAAEGGKSKKDLVFTLKDGTIINLNQYPQDLKKAVEVNGSNGATNEVLAQLDSLIEQLEKSPDTNKTELASLKDLANQGHRLATIENLIETSYKNAGSLENLQATEVTFEGKQYKIDDLSSMLGWQSSELTPESISDRLSTQNAGPELKQFIDLYFKAEGSGALNDPAVKKVVTNMSDNIAFLTEITESTAWTTSNVEFDAAAMDQYAASAATNLNSGGICQAGNNTDTGVQCK